MLWDRTYGFSSLSEKTGKSNHLQMSLKRQHFVLSYLRTLGAGPAGRGLNPRWTLRPVRLCWYSFRTYETNWAFLITVWVSLIFGFYFLLQLVVLSNISRKRNRSSENVPLVLICKLVSVFVFVSIFLFNSVSCVWILSLSIHGNLWKKFSWLHPLFISLTVYFISLFLLFTPIY